MLRDEQQRLAVAARIRELRGPAPQPVIAEKVGVGLRGYQKWEATGGIGWDNLHKLAAVHGVTVDWILYGDQERGETPDLMAAVNGNGAPDDLASLHRKLDLIIEYFGIKQADDGHPTTTYRAIYGPLPDDPTIDEESEPPGETGEPS